MRHMRMLFWAATACTALAWAAAARAQFLGQSGPLEGMATGSRMLGAYVGGGAGDVGPAAELRFATAPHATVGLGASVENKTFGMQADARAGLLNTGGDDPLELGGQLAGGFLTGGGSTGFYGQAVPGASFDWSVGRGQSFSTWAGLGFRLTAATHQVGRGDGVVRVGARFNFSPTVNFGASLEDVGGTSRIIAGAGYTF